MANLGSALRQLRKARVRAQREVQRFDEAITAIAKLVKGAATGTGRGRARRPRRRLSAAARKRIAAAQRARWAKIKQRAAA